MKTITKTIATKMVAATPATKMVAATVAAIAPRETQDIHPAVYGFVIGMLAGKHGQKCIAFLNRAKSHHDKEGTVFPRVPFKDNIHQSMVKGLDPKKAHDTLTQACQAWLSLVDLGQGGSLAGRPFSKALYDSYRVIKANY